MPAAAARRGIAPGLPEFTELVPRQGKMPDVSYQPLGTEMKNGPRLSMYESDLTRFMNELKAKNPQIAQGQAEGLAILWDKDPLDLDQRRRMLESRVKQQAYVYQSKS
jgi:hypothetical protein